VNIVVDSSSLITLSSSCLIKTLKNLSESKGLVFTIPESVYYESVKRPMNVKRFELNAVRIRDAVDEGYLKVQKATPNMREKIIKLSKITENLCFSEGKQIRLIDLGEAEALALLKETESRALMIDERTTRMLIEEPQNIRDFLEKRHRKKITLNQQALTEFREYTKGIRVMRSVELIALAYDNDGFKGELRRSKQALEAALYSAKFAGCAVSFEEIKEYLKNVRN